jgi:hypothetical protein
MRCIVDKEQGEFLAEKTKRVLSEMPWLAALRTKLLNLGGAAAVLWNGSNEQPFVENQLEHGREYSIVNIELHESRRNRCHDNSEELAMTKEDYHLATGYTLSREVWRPHSWAYYWRNKRILETTEVRKDISELTASRIQF